VTTTKQRSAARRNIKKAAKAAKRKRTVAHLRADERGMDLTRHGHVVGEAAAPGEEGRVLAPQGVTITAESQQALGQRRLRRRRIDSAPTRRV